ncbi:Uncharacterised protein [Escherichia coli]|nr:Uncharacterised protein [Escherichia coli]CUA54655.1 Uncharacterised protein [Escherichia coli]
MMPLRGRQPGGIHRRQPHKRMKKTVKPVVDHFPGRHRHRLRDPAVPVRRDAIEHLAVIRHQRFNPAPVQNTQFFDLPPGVTDFQHHRIAVTQFGVQPQFKKLDTILLCIGTTTETGNIPLPFFTADPLCIRLHQAQPHFGDILGYQRNARKHRVKGQNGFRIGFHTLLPGTGKRLSHRLKQGPPAHFSYVTS